MTAYVSDAWHALVSVGAGALAIGLVIGLVAFLADVFEPARRRHEIMPADRPERRTP
jgi:hypothetical protein